MSADQMSDAMRDNAGLPAARASQDQHRAIGSLYSFTLLGIKPRKKIHEHPHFRKPVWTWDPRRSPRLAEPNSSSQW